MNVCPLNKIMQTSCNGANKALKSLLLPNNETVVDTDRFMHYSTYGSMHIITHIGRKNSVKRDNFVTAWG
jgi:hypothetical protein